MTPTFAMLMSLYNFYARHVLHWKLRIPGLLWTAPFDNTMVGNSIETQRLTRFGGTTQKMGDADVGYADLSPRLVSGSALCSEQRLNRHILLGNGARDM